LCTYNEEFKKKKNMWIVELIGTEMHKIKLKILCPEQIEDTQKLVKNERTITNVGQRLGFSLFCIDIVDLLDSWMIIRQSHKRTI